MDTTTTSHVRVQTAQTAALVLATTPSTIQSFHFITRLAHVHVGAAQAPTLTTFNKKTNSLLEIKGDAIIIGWIMVSDRRTPTCTSPDTGIFATLVDMDIDNFQFSDAASPNHPSSISHGKKESIYGEGPERREHTEQILSPYQQQHQVQTG